jgi:hypothetical protein
LDNFLSNFEWGDEAEVSETVVIQKMRELVAVSCNNEEEELFEDQLKYLLTKCLDIVDGRELRFEAERLRNIEEAV